MPVTISRIFSSVSQLATACVLTTLVAPAHGQGQSSYGTGGGGGRIIITGNSVVDTVSLTGTANLPLGVGGADIPSNVTLTSTRANHNSTRSNRTSSAADIDTNFPDDFDGDELPLESSWVIDFDLVITPVDDPFGSEFGNLGDNVLLQPLAPIDLDLSAPTSVFFDAAAPEFGLLQVSPTGVREWISNPASGHSLHGAGGILVENLAVEASYVGGEPAWERRTRTTNQSSGESDFLFGEFDITLSLEGTLNGQSFTISSLTGMVVEEVTFSATFVPEPTAFGLCLATLVGAATRRRR